MTNIEAIKILSNGVLNGKDDTPENNEAIELAIKSLEKGVPKKSVRDESDNMWAICPLCFGSIYKYNIIEYIQNGEASHCEHCGQAIDWSEIYD